MNLEMLKTGNPVNYIGKANLSWNGKQLISFVQDGKKVELTYDANGIINCKKVNGKDTIYDKENNMVNLNSQPPSTYS
jgi:hypothetical protein